MRLLLPAWLFIYLLCLGGCRAVSEAQRLALRDETASLFRHGYDGYMRYAYPADELKPLTCGPLRRDPNPANIGINDIHANVSITLLDTLSSLPLIYPSAFPRAVQLVAEKTSFDQDVKVQVFEMTIRAMGSLLSTYQYLDELPDDPSAQAQALGLAGEDSWTWGKKSVDVKRYRRRMLDLAHDLGKRLLPAFNTLTGIPYARVNLRHGVDKGESIETCTAGAGSLLLEFALLSRLTGDDRFENLAHRAYMALWNRRSPQNLLGNTIGATHGHWLAPGFSGVGAGMDSFFEYGLKAGIMLNDDTYMDIFYDSYAAIQSHVRTTDGFLYRPVQTRLLQPAIPSTIDSLSAFLAGAQVLAGDIESAIKSHLIFWNLWRKYSAIPESWSWAERKIEWAGWPGRPEFIESTYYLYQATRDPFYLRVGERVLNDLKRRTKTKCGFATIKNVESGDLEDRMESFVLSETLKYLYLLFSNTPFANANKVFTTEGHALTMPTGQLRPPSLARRAMRKGENQFCPIYEPHKLGGQSQGIVGGIVSRPEYEYARALVFGWGEEGLGVEAEGDRALWRPDGVCTIPTTPKFSFEVVLSPLDTTNATQLPAEDPSPGSSKVQQDPETGDFAITDIEGLRLGVRWRFDGKGYDVTNIGPHRVHPGQQVSISDPAMHGYLPVPAKQPSNEGETNNSPPEVLLRFTVYPQTASGQLHLHLQHHQDGVDGQDQDQDGRDGQGSTLFHAIAATATFGRDFGLAKPDERGWSINGKGLRLVIPQTQVQLDGCSPIDPSVVGIGVSQSGENAAEEEGKEEGEYVIMLQRGGCTFLEKLLHARALGAKGVMVVGYPPLSLSEEEVGGGMDRESDTIEGEGSWEEVGLIRPSADVPPTSEGIRDRSGANVNGKAGAGKEGREELSGIGMVYTEYLVGEILQRIVQVEQKVIGIEILPLGPVDEVESATGAGSGAFPRGDGPPEGGRATGVRNRDQINESGTSGRSGRLVVGDWEIWNLRVVEKPPKPPR